MNTSKKISLATIEAAAKKHADNRDALKQIVQALNDQIAAIKRVALPDIKRAVARAAESEHQLRADIAAAPDLFVQPRTVIFHGLKCGYEKGKLKLVCPDPDQACDLIRKHFPDLAETLIVTKLSPNKKALAELGPKDLKRLGLSLEDPGDQIVIRAVDSDVDKIVTALLADAAADN
jgi:hypothetical protein